MCLERKFKLIKFLKFCKYLFKFVGLIYVIRRIVDYIYFILFVSINVYNYK